MESNLQPKVDAHQITVDLDGLDQLLEVTPEEIDIDQFAPAQTGERELLVKLMERVHMVNASVEEARLRITQANERMSTLAAVLQLQTEQLELLAHYQSQAARATSLEIRIANLEEENNQLKQPFWKKLVARFQRSQ